MWRSNLMGVTLTGAFVSSAFAHTSVGQVSGRQSSIGKVALRMGGLAVLSGLALMVG